MHVLHFYHVFFLVSTLVVSGIMNTINTINLYLSLCFTLAQVLHNKMNFTLHILGSFCFILLVWLFVLFFFNLRQSFTMLWLSQKSLCRTGWPQAYRHPVVYVSQMRLLCLFLTRKSQVFMAKVFICFSLYCSWI